MPVTEVRSGKHTPSEWEEPKTTKPFKSELQVPGRGLGRIHASQFETATWISSIKLPAGQGQFGKFVDAMMNRIRFEESSPEEVHRFVELIVSDDDWNFLRVAVTHIPELNLVHLHDNDNKNFQLALLFQQLKSKMHQRIFEEIRVNKRGRYCDQPMAKPLSHTLPSSTGLIKAEKAYVEQSLFDHYPEPVRTPAMNRLLEGTLALGWPVSALQQQRQEALRHGIQVNRDCGGLPMCMLIPGPPMSQPVLPLQNPIPAPTTNSNNMSLTIPSSSVVQAASATGLNRKDNSPPYKLLTEADKIPYIEQSVTRGKGKIVQINVPKIIVTPVSPTSAVFPTNIYGELGSTKVTSRKVQSPELKYLHNLPTIVFSKPPPKGPIYPKMRPEPTVVPRIPKQTFHAKAYEKAMIDPDMVILSNQITKTHRLSKVLEAKDRVRRW